MKLAIAILLLTTPSGLAAQTIVNTQDGAKTVPSTTQDSAEGTVTFIYPGDGSVVTIIAPETVPDTNDPD